MWVCVRALPAPCQSWLGCAVWMCALGCGFRLPPVITCWGVMGLVCFCARAACTLPFLARLSERVCLCACSACTLPAMDGVCGVAVCACLAFPLRPATPGWGVGGCVFACAFNLGPAFTGWVSWFLGWV